MPSPFLIEVTIEHGQLHEHLALEEDRQLMIDRLEAILDGDNTDVRKGVIQILMDQLRTNNGHEPIIIRSGLASGDVEEQVIWQSVILRVDDNDRTKKEIVEIDVDLAKYRPTGKTPHKGKEKNPFKFKNDSSKGRRVSTEKHKEPEDTKLQSFYKFTIKAENPLKGLPDLELDPCIICDR